MAKAKAIDRSSPPTTATREAAARIVATRSEELIAEARGVLDTGDIERVHDMRVATRRLRAALEVFEPCFPRKPFRQALREVKRLADALGERRDRDVGDRSSCAGFNEQMPAPDRRGVESLIERLRAEQDRRELGPGAAGRPRAPRRPSSRAWTSWSRRPGRPSPLRSREGGAA